LFQKIVVFGKINEMKTENFYWLMLFFLCSTLDTFYLFDKNDFIFRSINVLIITIIPQVFLFKFFKAKIIVAFVQNEQETDGIKSQLDDAYHKLIRWSQLDSE